MLILYAVMKYDYGQLERGYSYEHYNFFDTLVHMGHDIIYFDFMTLLRQYGKTGMNRRLLEVVKAEKPALMFTELFTDEIEPRTVNTISKDTETITLNWFTDDHWRFDGFSRHWASRFNWVVTTTASALPKYATLGHQNVLKSQWACNQFLYRKLDLPPIYDVTFVGQPHGDRPQIIQAIRDSGIGVQVWGTGWESGRLSQDGMIRVFNQSRINLNLSNASTGAVRMPAYKAAYHTVSQSLNVLPYVPEVKKTLKSWLGMNSERAAAPANMSYSQQIKGRNFEVPGCGGMLLTGRADNLEDYYEVGQEVACYENTADLIDKIKYYLQHEDERVALAEAGYRRTLAEHTYVHRFTDIFQRIGLPPRGDGSGQV
jgi:spore maturation protein CgeB